MESVVEESKMIEDLINCLKTKQSAYNYIGIKKVLLEVIASDFPELAETI